MAHFAKLDESNLVIEVHAVNNSDNVDSNGKENEAIGVAFLVQWSGGYPHWKQTSYNGNIRKNYAGIGYTYDPQRDAFIPVKPYHSWVLNENTCQWQAPVAMPQDGKMYAWNEDSISWVEINAV